MRNFEATTSSTSGDQARSIVDTDGDTQSFVHVEMIVPPWAEGNELQAEGKISLIQTASLR